uniref:Uncharacterized protein n=1 Tax=Romanomermis culicivorax TaxID=13658 RepID=A0A915JSC1_ROMCU
MNPCSIDGNVPEDIDLGMPLRQRRPLKLICSPPSGCDFEAENLINEDIDLDISDNTLNRNNSRNKITFSSKNSDLLIPKPSGVNAAKLTKKLRESLVDGEKVRFCIGQNLPPNEPSSVKKPSSSTTFFEPPFTSSSDRDVGFFNFFWFELTRGYALENDEARYTEKRKKVYAFVHIPKELEKFLFYGYLQCLDAFLYIFTFLPLRFFMAIGHFFAGLLNIALSNKPLLHRRRFLAPGETCDILKVIIILTASFFMTFIDTSVIYHVVRGQAVIKLYIFFNMIEVADKLFSSFGQDILDALFWSATEPRRKNSPSMTHVSSVFLLPEHIFHMFFFIFQVNYFGFGVVTHLLLAICYVLLHTCLVLLQATTLNVAFNSHNKALLTIMLSNNFVELKGNVFKKFAKNNLFQMACSDVRERFHYFVLLSVVVVRNMTAVDWRPEHFFEMVPDLILVMIGELLVDWMKHAFITKFNEIPYEVYKDFTITIAYDAAKSRDISAFSDHSDQVARRMGFIPLPLSVLVIRILTQSFAFENLAHLILWTMTFVCVLLFKIFNSIFVLGKAARYIRQYEELQKRADLWKRLNKRHRSKSVPSSPKLSLIEFTDVMQQSQPLNKMYVTASDLLSQQQVEEWLFAGIPSSPQSAADVKLSKRRSKSVAYLDNVRRMMQNEENAAADTDQLQSTAVPESSTTAQLPTVDYSASTAAAKSVSHSPAPASDVNTAQPQSPTTEDTSPPAAVTSHEASTMPQDMQALLGVDRYTLVNGDRIES